jgi:hypothetical protein
MGLAKDDGKKKTAVNKVYDFTKIGTDVADQHVDKYTTSTKSVKWTKKLFSYILDISRTNGQTIFAKNMGIEPRKSNSEKFLWMLVLQLVVPFVQERKSVKWRYLQLNTRKQINYFLETNELDQEEEGADAPAPARACSFPHACKPDTRGGRCKVCCNDIHGEGYNKKIKKISAAHTQCQKG